MNFRGKKVLLRVDFNVPLSGGKVADDFRIRAHIPTIKMLLKKGAQVFLITHLEVNGKTPHLGVVRNLLERLLDLRVGFARGKLPVSRRFFERAVLLDNIRLNPGEKKNDLKFAKLLATWGDYYINDAFAVSHREHASIVLLPKLLPHETGPLLKAEIKNLSKFFKPRRPFLVIIGGKKFETKEPLISKLLKSADAVFIVGAIGNTFLARRGISVGKSKIESVKIPKNVVWNNKILLPEDWVMKNGVILDAGPKTVRALSQLAKKAEFVLWNGTLGLCEKGFEYGTRTLAKELGKSKAYKVVGGGDTVAAIRKFKLEKNFDFISTGGGAMLGFLAKGTLPGIEALRKKTILDRIG